MNYVISHSAERQDDEVIDSKENPESRKKEEEAGVTNEENDNDSNAAQRIGDAADGKGITYAYDWC